MHHNWSQRKILSVAQLQRCNAHFYGLSPHTTAAAAAAALAALRFTRTSRMPHVERGRLDEDFLSLTLAVGKMRIDGTAAAPAGLEPPGFRPSVGLSAIFLLRSSGASLMSSGYAGRSRDRTPRARIASRRRPAPRMPPYNAA
jgi:hypothetical protein